MLTKPKLRDIHKKLLRWFHEEKREMPWRNTKDPYYIWVSEIMLQQTRVKTVIPYYEGWIESFPTLADLACASESKVLKHWEGLGYYSRVRNLHRAAKIVLLEHEGRVPDTIENISKLPGIGRYTAGAILSMAFGKRFPVLDGNVKRVLSRLFCLPENGSTTRSERHLWDFSEKILPIQNVGDFNQAIMELGATICLPRNQRCEICPLSKACEANKDSRQAEFPPAKAKTVARKIEVSAGIIWKRGKIFIQKRPKDGLMGGLWEFPGGKREKTETVEECLIREIREELGVNIKVKRKFMKIKHSYTQFRVTLHVFECGLLSGRIHARHCEQWRWISPCSLQSFVFPAANVKIVERLTKNINF